MRVSLESYGFLVLLLGIPFLWWVRRTTRLSLHRRHLDLMTAVRSAVVLLLALAIARPVWQRSGTWVSIVYVLDVSASVSADFVDSALGWIGSANEQGRPESARYVVFGARAEVVETLEGVRSLPVWSQQGVLRAGPAPAGTIDPGATNIEEALVTALGSFAPHSVKRLVLFTDGRETAGDAARALWLARSRGVRVFVVPAVVRAEGDAFVESVGTPENVRAGEPVEVQMRVFARKATDAALEIRRLLPSGAEVLGRRNVRLEEGENRFAFEIRLRERGLAAIEARVFAERDPFPENDLWRLSIRVGATPKVLHVEGRPEAAHYLRDALQGEGLEVIGSLATRLPETSDALGGYDAIILSDVPAGRLSTSQMAAVRAYVRDQGGGLVFIGGETSYGASGYAGTVLEEALPVRFRTREKHKDLALAIVLDKSYSMKGEKLELAKEACKAALDLLDEEHLFGLVTFDWYPHQTVPLQSVKNRAEMRALIGRVEASSPTRIYHALEEAHRQLVDSKAKVKHVILLSDGKSYADDFESLVGRMAKDRITVSTVAIGEEADRELLSNLSRWGNGRSYFAEDAARVPEIFIREAEIASETTLVEEAFSPRVKRSIEAFRGVDFSKAPPLRGYVTTLAKPNAEVLLESPTESPVLARWHYGLGRAVVFASDAKNRWASEWLGWEGFGKLWAQILRETMRRPDRNLDFRVSREADVAVITLTGIDDDGRFLDALRARAERIDPRGERTVVPLRQIGPGTYEARLSIEAPAESPHVFRLLEPAASTPDEDALFYTYPDEYRFYPADTDLLRSLGEATGGKLDPTIEEVFGLGSDRAARPTALWPALAGLALLLYLGEIALRRVPGLGGRLTPGRADPTPPAPKSLLGA